MIYNLPDRVDTSSPRTLGRLLPFARKLARRIFPIFFFDYFHILVSNLLDIERLNNSTDFVDSYGVVLAWVRTF